MSLVAVSCGVGNGSDPALLCLCGCSSNLTHGLRTYICHGCGPKQKKPKKLLDVNEEGKKNPVENLAKDVSRNSANEL